MPTEKNCELCAKPIGFDRQYPAFTFRRMKSETHMLNKESLEQYFIRAERSQVSSQERFPYTLSRITICFHSALTLQTLSSAGVYIFVVVVCVIVLIFM